MQITSLRPSTYARTIGHTHPADYEHARNRALIRCLKIVADLRENAVVFNPDELVPKMLAVGESRGTKDFEGTVIDLLNTLAKKIPSGEYGRDVESTQKGG